MCDNIRANLHRSVALVVVVLDELQKTNERFSSDSKVRDEDEGVDVIDDVLTRTPIFNR